MTAAETMTSAGALRAPKSVCCAASMPMAAARRLASIAGLSTSGLAAPMRLASSGGASSFGSEGMIMTTPSRCIHAAMSQRTAGSLDDETVPCRCRLRSLASATSNSPPGGPFWPVLPCPPSRSIGSRLSPEPRSEVFSPTPLSSVSDPLPSLLPLPSPESFFASASDPPPEPELTPVFESTPAAALPLPEPSPPDPAPDPPPERPPEPDPEPDPPEPPLPVRFWWYFLAAAMARAAAVDPFSVGSLEAARELVDHSRNCRVSVGRSGWTSTCSHVHASYGNPHHLTSAFVHTLGSEPESDPPLPELLRPRPTAP